MNVVPSGIRKRSLKTIRETANMRTKQVNPSRTPKNYRNYSSAALIEAFKLVKDKGVSVRKASILYNVPLTTLRDRIDGRVDANNFKMETLFSFDEEKKLVEHLQTRAEIGYGCSSIYTRKLAGEMAYEMGKRPNNTTLSNNWLSGFLKRWKEEIGSIRPSQLETPRAKSATPEAIQQYFQNLHTVLEENGLINKPERIYNLDETGVTPEHKPSNIIGNPRTKVQAITSSRTGTTTIIGCGNAIGQALPPFFIFKGKRWVPELMEGMSAGARGTMSESGWSNSLIFKEYLQEHFLPLVRSGNDSSEPILLLYDGHSSHKTPETIRWARENVIILFVLPAHTSHLLQPLDISVFGAFKKYYYAEVSQYLFNHPGQSLTRYQICQLACQSYLKSFSPMNIVAGFKKSGIFPFNKDVLDPSQLYPYESFREKKVVEKVKALKSGPEAVELFLQQKEDQIIEQVVIDEKGDNCPTCQRKFTKKKVNPSGKEITSNTYIQLLETDEEKRDEGTMRKKANSQPMRNIPSPKPSTSGYNDKSKPTQHYSEDDDDSEELMDDRSDELCCVCNKFSPPDLKKIPMIKIVNWGQCEECGHWVHLGFCIETRVIRRHSTFLCPHCTD